MAHLKTGIRAGTRQRVLTVVNCIELMCVTAVFLRPYRLRDFRAALSEENSFCPHFYNFIEFWNEKS
jgi:hypothetical protein